MQKKVLTEQALYYGDISMPKGFEINHNELKSDILESLIKNEKFIFNKSWDLLNTYIKDFFNVKHKKGLINKETWGNVYAAKKTTEPLKEIDPVDLKNSADFALLYGVEVKDCFIKIYYDDNRRKGRSWDIELKNNMFIMFPTTNMYIISNKHTDKSLNFIQTITYDYI
jgi:hypothetical protein